MNRPIATGHPPAKEGWEERFWNVAESIGANAGLPEMRDFIRAEIASAREQGANAAVEEVIKYVEKEMPNPEYSADLLDYLVARTKGKEN